MTSVLIPNSSQAEPNSNSRSSKSLQLLLFVDERPSSQEHIKRIQSHLRSLQIEYPFELEAINVGEHPDLVEHFRLIATPALVKIHPQPRQILAGSDLIDQLKQYWNQWKYDAQTQERDRAENSAEPEIRYSLDKIRFRDEIFRLKKEKEELLEQLQFKDQILAMLAHDLRSPLTAASIAVETIELTQNQPDVVPRRDFAQQLCRQARTQLRLMNRMITDILQASRGNQSQFQLHCHPLSLSDLCEAILAEFRERMKRKALVLEIDIPQDLPKVYADKELIRQVLLNLLDNALKYTPECGTINVSILHRTSQKVQVSVCDTGPGIPEEKRDRVFEGHFRLKRDEAQEGYGLGLALCRKVIQSHFGQIWVDSASDCGSCFHFTLPVYR
ncbi:histidine kinase [Lusitaniella coriacea LEGE 07167]